MHSISFCDLTCELLAMFRDSCAILKVRFTSAICTLNGEMTCVYMEKKKKKNNNNAPLNARSGTS